MLSASFITVLIADQAPLQTHRDHMRAVLDVDYSPTGKEFVSGSYDRTIRIFNFDMVRVVVVLSTMVYVFF